jgi:hypothetical protein
MAQVDPRHPEARAVKEQECAAVARLWRTGEEAEARNAAGGEGRNEAPAESRGLARLRSDGS